MEHVADVCGMPGERLSFMGSILVAKTDEMGVACDVGQEELVTIERFVVR